MALLLIDWINDLEFEGGEQLLPAALRAAKAVAALRQRARQAGVPVVYCNDNFGRWRPDFRTLLEHVLHDAYMRNYSLIVPRDCLASEEEADNRHALEHMAKTCKADTGPAAGIDLARLGKAA